VDEIVSAAAASCGPAKDHSENLVDYVKALLDAVLRNVQVYRFFHDLFEAVPVLGQLVQMFLEKIFDAVGNLNAGLAVFLRFRRTIGRPDGGCVLPDFRHRFGSDHLRHKGGLEFWRTFKHLHEQLTQMPESPS